MGTLLYKGKDFKMFVQRGANLVQVCYATDFEINVDFGTLEVSGPQSRWRDYIADYNGYTLSAPGLTVYKSDTFNYLDFLKAGAAGTRLNWEGSAFPNGGIRHRGTMLVTSLNQSSPLNEVLKFTMTAIGCGEMAIVYLPTTQVVYLANFNNVRLAGCPNPYPVSIFWYDGTLIGLAMNADDVIQTFNSYSAQQGGLYTLTTVAPGSCNFNMSIAYEAPKPYPTVIYAQQGADFALSTDQNNDVVVSPDQDNNLVLTPIGTA